MLSVVLLQHSNKLFLPRYFDISLDFDGVNCGSWEQ